MRAGILALHAGSIGRATPAGLLPFPSFHTLRPLSSTGTTRRPQSYRSLSAALRSTLACPSRGSGWCVHIIEQGSTRRQLPRLPIFRTDADANTPTGTVRDTCRLSARSVVGTLPQNLRSEVGSRIAGFGRPAQRSLQAFRPTRSLELLYATLCGRSASENVVNSIPPPRAATNRSDNCSGGIRTHQENAPFHGARKHSS